MHEFNHIQYIDNFTNDSKDKIWERLVIRHLGGGEEARNAHFMKALQGSLFLSIDEI